VVIVEIVFITSHWRRIREVTRDSRPVLAELEEFLPVLRLLEQQRFESPTLRSIHGSLTTDGEPPSVRVARLNKLLDAWDTALRNQFVLPVAIVLMAPMHLVYAIERWRIRDGRRVGAWLDAVGAFEALCSLSGFAYEHPEYPFAQIDDNGPIFEAEKLAHPLLPASRRIANDLSIGTEPALLLVSGSNMSGKSTLMRAVGVNAVLALAGAPVCASRVRVSPLTVATAMRQGDSLLEGVSAFYAEIRRLQAIRELSTGPTPVLFLLDEILRGTNSHDRRIGAEAVIAILLKNGGIGMVSTHDLALAEIVDRLDPRAANVHFEDELVDGQVRFDYRLRPGVVPRGNGLVLLRLLGFDV
jgi:DNA mismatch repair ATPase MutS